MKKSLKIVVGKCFTAFCVLLCFGIVSSSATYAQDSSPFENNTQKSSENDTSGSALGMLNSIRGFDEQLTSFPTEATIEPDFSKELEPLKKYYRENMTESEIENVITQIADGENAIFGDGAVDISAMSLQRWGSANGTHQWAVSRGFAILGNEASEARNCFNSSAVSTIMEYADWPDNNETSGNNNWHFYNWYTKTNYWHQTSPTAKDRFIYWYESAVRQYRSGDKNTSFQSLGKAIHYLSDLGTPVHVGDQATFDYQKGYYIINALAGIEHGRYETQAGQIKQNYNVSSGGYYDYYLSYNLDGMADIVAETAHRYYVIGKSGRFQYPLENVQRNVAGLLCKFAVAISSQYK